VKYEDEEVGEFKMGWNYIAPPPEEAPTPMAAP
jgi:hypothetical protein